jgi:hypothetical protein
MTILRRKSLAMSSARPERHKSSRGSRRKTMKSEPEHNNSQPDLIEAFLLIGSGLAHLGIMLFSTINSLLVAALPLASAAVIKRNSNYRSVLYWVSWICNVYSPLGQI